MQVQNIITEPTNRSTRFILYGQTDVESNGQNFEQGVLVTVDLDELHQRRCVGTDAPGEQNSDYELWTPSGLVNPECLFGKKVHAASLAHCTSLGHLHPAQTRRPVLQPREVRAHRERRDLCLHRRGLRV